LRDGVVAASAQGLYEGRVPFEMKGAKLRGQCSVLEREEVESGATYAVETAEKELALVERHDAIPLLAGVEPVRDWLFLARASARVKDAAAWIGWSPDVVRGLASRIEAASANWQKARKERFYAIHASATGGATLGSVELRLTHLRCGPKDVFRPPLRAPDFIDALTLGALRRQPEPVHGCGFELSVTNRGSSPLDVEEFRSRLRLVGPSFADQLTFASVIRDRRLEPPATTIAAGATETIVAFVDARTRSVAATPLLLVELIYGKPAEPDTERGYLWIQ
jgi:hypothetical protein